MAIIFLVGMMGAGKTRTGRRLASAMELTFYDMDREIEEQEKMSVTDIFEKVGETAFRQMEHDWLLRFVQNNQSAVVSTGGGAPCFFNNMNLMNTYGVTIWLSPEKDELVDRLWRNRFDRPKIAKLANKEALDGYLQVLLEEREPYYRQAKITVCEAIPDVHWVVKQIVEMSN